MRTLFASAILRPALATVVMLKLVSIAFPRCITLWGRMPVTVLLFATTIFLSAFLLFQVQPVVSKYILPWFGSTPGVWATALLFFQVVLLLGYGYSHFIVSRFTWHRQAIIHIALLCLTLLVLPITPVEALKPEDASAPVERILIILTLSVGAPFFLLSTTAPLIQRWFALLHPGRSPYRLYALSNAGSLLALMSYPFVIERFVYLQTQTWVWSLAYGLFVVFCATCAWRMRRLTGEGTRALQLENDNSPVNSAGKPGKEPVLSVMSIGLWMALSACGSGLLVATTNQMSLDIAAVPFLWVVPLGIYLLTFILCFDSDRWYIRPLYAALLPMALINSLRILYEGSDLGIVDQVLGYSLTLFIACMCCHGELARMRPAPEKITLFFLVNSIGGALGGLFVAVLSPALFAGFYEYHLLLLVCATLMVLVLIPLYVHGETSGADQPNISLLARLCWFVAVVGVFTGVVLSFYPGSWYIEESSTHVVATYAQWRSDVIYGIPYALGVVLLVNEAWRRQQKQNAASWWTSLRGARQLGMLVILSSGLFSLAVSLQWQIREEERHVVARDRNFYGVLAVKEQSAGYTGHIHSLMHGRISHGVQLQKHLNWPTAYYGLDSGIGLALQYHPSRQITDRQFRVGVVGLGVGTLAAYGNARFDPEMYGSNFSQAIQLEHPDYLGFYELNPMVIEWARTRFTFLADAKKRGLDIAVFEGDARIVLERQLKEGEGQLFDVLAIDAFSSDAIPIHLITLEAFSTYLKHLREGGILGFHVSNRFIDLIPVLARLAEVNEMRAVYIRSEEDDEREVSTAHWVLLSNNRAFFDNNAVFKDAKPMPATGPLWTDNFSSIFEVLKLD